MSKSVKERHYIGIIQDLLFAYINKDDMPHKFEIDAVKEALSACRYSNVNVGKYSDSFYYSVSEWLSDNLKQNKGGEDER